MSDLIDEVNEELRAERARKLAQRYGGLVAGVVLLAIAGVGGWEAWRWHERREAGKAAESFLATTRDAAAEGAELKAIADRFIAMAPDQPMPHDGYSVRELVHLIRSEAVEHLDDLLMRRTTLAITGELSLAMADAALDVLATEKGWSAQRAAEERSRFLTLMGERHGVTEKSLSARNEQRSELCETSARSG